MSDDSSSNTSHQAVGTVDVENKMNFADFLESVPPNQDRNVTDFYRAQTAPPPQIFRLYLKYPELRLHCDDTACGGPRAFRYIPNIVAGVTSEIHLTAGQSKSIFLRYRCVNCQRSIKLYAIIGVPDTVTDGAVVRKIGEVPPYGPPTPSGMIKLVGPDRDLFLKGRQCETQGLGIGAFSYYRRVVENQKSRILGKIADVATKSRLSSDVVDKIKAAQKETQFTKAVDMVKDIIPANLMIRGHNPLSLLHSALSEGLHDRDDELCLEAAHDIRVVLAELSERITQALKDEKELNDSLSRLITRNQKKNL